MNWMTAFDGFMEALDGISAESYLASMNRSLALVMDEFYQCLTSIGVSSAIGFGRCFWTWTGSTTLWPVCV